LNIKKIKKAFTLVELIVVITILAILATIAFISFQGSTSEANNTKVVSDVRNLVAKVSIIN
jgi:prepilin-type N-terminal cleavage/methylation domain-containing protein